MIIHSKCVVSLSEGLTSEARFANAVVAVDSIFADAIVTWVAGTVIIVDLTVDTCLKKSWSFYIWL